MRKRYSDLLHQFVGRKMASDARRSFQIDSYSFQDAVCRMELRTDGQDVITGIAVIKYKITGGDCIRTQTKDIGVVREDINTFLDYLKEVTDPALVEAAAEVRATEEMRQKAERRRDDEKQRVSAKLARMLSRDDFKGFRKTVETIPDTHGINLFEGLSAKFIERHLHRRRLGNILSFLVEKNGFEEVFKPNVFPQCQYDTLLPREVVAAYLDLASPMEMGALMARYPRLFCMFPLHEEHWIHVAFLAASIRKGILLPVVLDWRQNLHLDQWDKPTAAFRKLLGQIILDQWFDEEGENVFPTYDFPCQSKRTASSRIASLFEIRKRLSRPMWLQYMSNGTVTRGDYASSLAYQIQKVVNRIKNKTFRQALADIESIS